MQSEKVSSIRLKEQIFLFYFFLKIEQKKQPTYGG